MLNLLPFEDYILQLQKIFPQLGNSKSKKKSLIPFLQQLLHLPHHFVVDLILFVVSLLHFVVITDKKKIRSELPWGQPPSKSKSLCPLHLCHSALKPTNPKPETRNPKLKKDNAPRAAPCGPFGLAFGEASLRSRASTAHRGVCSRISHSCVFQCL